MSFFHVELLDKGTHFHAAGPHDARSFQTFVPALVLKLDFVTRNLHHARFRMNFNARFVQRVFDNLTDLFAHSRYDFVAHLDDYHSRFALKCPALERVVKQVSHLGREFTATGAGAHYGKRHFAPHVLRC